METNWKDSKDLFRWQVLDQVCDQVGDQVWLLQARAQVQDQVWDQVEIHLWENLNED